jgi:hypothetical protein
VPVPLFDNWIVCVAGVPSVTLPKLALEGVTAKAGCTALPATEITVFAPWALATVIFPVMFSEAVGLNVTLIVAFWPAANVSGVTIPLMLKSFAFTVIWEIVRLAVPALLRVTVFEFELPLPTPEKVTLPGFDASVTDAAEPVPVKVNTLGESDAFVVMPTEPARLPAVVGAKRTLKVLLPPGGTVTGVASPLTLYALPLAVNCVMVKAAVPVLVKAIVCDFVCPSTTLPKL